MSTPISTGKRSRPSEKNDDLERAPKQKKEEENVPGDTTDSDLESADDETTLSEFEFTQEKLNEISDSPSQLDRFIVAGDKLVLTLPSRNERTRIRKLITAAEERYQLLATNSATVLGDTLQVAPTSTILLDQACLNKISQSKELLDEFIKECDRQIKLLKSSQLDERDVLVGLRAIAKDRKESLEKKVKDNAQQEQRLAPLDFKVQDEDLVHELDYHAFKKRVDDLFLWHHEGSTLPNTYMSPYFPMVQSSGMGKTKLMFTLLKDQQKDYRAILVLCTWGGNKPNTDHDKQVFQHVLDVSKLSTVPSIDEAFNKILKVEEKMHNALIPALPVDQPPPVQGLKQPTKKLVIMFDEAHHMVEQTAMDALVFRRIRNILRHHNERRHLVAVFTGTSSNLANSYNEKKGSGDSRNIDYPYNEGTMLYEPFYQFCTIGCFRASNSKGEDKSGPEKATSIAGIELSDYHRSIPYGRPLFALLYKDAKRKKQDYLTLEQYGRILYKMLLGANSLSRLESCLSILATRVQLGRTGFLVSCDLVAKGYGNLVNFTQSTDGRPDSAQIRYFRDPVPARLAMCLMDKDWDFDRLGDDRNNDFSHFVGKSPEFWTRKLTKILSNGLCLAPKGDIGEMAAALYMLFCGDVLRKEAGGSDKITSYTTFAVDIGSWFSLLRNGGWHNPGARKAATSAGAQLTLSCIQFCRSELRWDPWVLFNQDFLKTMFESGVAFYLHAGSKAVDMVCAVRHQQPGEEDQYLPLLVSVKTVQDFSKSDAKKAQDKMVEMVKRVKRDISEGKKVRCICLLLVLDCEPASTSTSGPERVLDEVIWLNDLKLATVTATAPGRGLEEQAAVQTAAPSSNPSLSKSEEQPVASTASKAGKPDFPSWGIFKGDDDFCVLQQVVVPMNDSFGISTMIKNTCQEREEMAEVYSSIDSMGDISLEEIGFQTFVLEMNKLSNDIVWKEEEEARGKDVSKGSEEKNLTKEVGGTKTEETKKGSKGKKPRTVMIDADQLNDAISLLRKEGLKAWLNGAHPAAAELLKEWRVRRLGELPEATVEDVNAFLHEHGAKAWLRKTGRSSEAGAKVTSYLENMWRASITMACGSTAKKEKDN